jgi:hypothetical protein
MNRRTRFQSLLLSATLISFAGCSPEEVGPIDNGPSTPEPGHAFLTIVGDRNVFIEGGAQATLVVKYHDETGAPLAGQVHFKVQGMTYGSNVSSDSDVTNAQGLAQIDVLGAGNEAAFQVIAEAEYATAVDWRIAVSAGEPPLPPLSPAGTYDLDSQFDMVSGLPGNVGTVVNTFIAMTDGPNDPASWFIDLARDEIDSSTIRDLIDGLRPELDIVLNEMITSWSPDFVDQIVDLGDSFGQIAKKLGTTSELHIVAGGPDGNELTATHTLNGVVYTVDGVRYEYTMAELDLGNVTAEGLQCSMPVESQLLIGDHNLPLSYGRILLFGLNHVLIPLIDPWSSSVEDLLHYYIDCYAIGAEMSDYIGFGSTDFYESICDTALAAASAYIEDQIASIDSTATTLSIHGESHPQDTTGDRKVDKLTNGLWEGTMNFGSVASTLAKPDQKFTGQRMGIE